MPNQPPRFRAPGAVARAKPWAPMPGQATKRLRGRAGQRARAQVLAEEPLCRECLKAGRERPSEEVDHIKPLAEGGAETRSNRQGLCKFCHEAKSAAERTAARDRSAMHYRVR